MTVDIFHVRRRIGGHTMALQAFAFRIDGAHAGVVGLAGFGNHALPLVMVPVPVEPAQHLLFKSVCLVDRVHRVGGGPPVFELRKALPDAGHDLPPDIRGRHGLGHEAVRGHQRRYMRAQQIFDVGAGSIGHTLQELGFLVDFVFDHSLQELIGNGCGGDAVKKEDAAGTELKFGFYGKFFHERGSSVIGNYAVDASALPDHYTKHGP